VTATRATGLAALAVHGRPTLIPALATCPTIALLYIHTQHVSEFKNIIGVLLFQVTAEFAE
jgi:hypothetical protein